MPVEIRELVIRTIVTEKAEDDDSESGNMLQASNQTDDVVQECVRQVLRILRKERER